jgi:hypothetical protein
MRITVEIMSYVLKGHYFHNRRSSTCGERLVIPLLPKRQDFRTFHKFFNKSVCHYIDDRHFIFRILIRHKITNIYLIDYYLLATTFLCPANFFSRLIAALFRIIPNKKAT